MSHGLLLEFDGKGAADYDAVNQLLGIDMGSGTGDWPDGLQYHVAGLKGDGLVVFEIWESKEQQERFLQERLGPALHGGGIEGPPDRVEWLGLLAQHDVAALTAAG